MRSPAGAVALACLVTLLSSLPAAAAAVPAQQDEITYIIHLKNGSQLRTSRYWEDSGDYRIDIFGGVVGINKIYVERIEAVRRGSELAAGPLAAPGPAAPAAAAPAGVFTRITSYVQELMNWMGGLMARLWSPRRQSREGVQAGEGQPGGPKASAAARRGPPTPGGGPPLPVMVLVLAAVIPSFFLVGKALGGWLFAPRHA